MRMEGDAAIPSRPSSRCISTTDKGAVMPWMSLLLKMLYHRINGSITPLPYDFRHLAADSNTWQSNNSVPHIYSAFLLRRDTALQAGNIFLCFFLTHGNSAKQTCTLGASMKLRWLEAKTGMSYI